MNNHQRNCEMSALGWAASVPPRCTCNSTKELSKCCNLCRPNTLEHKAGLDTCRISFCACHIFQETSKCCGVEKGFYKKGFCSKCSQPFIPKEDHIADVGKMIEEVNTWEEEFDKRFGRAGFRVNNVDWEICSPEIKEFIKFLLLSHDKELVEKGKEIKLRADRALLSDDDFTYQQGLELFIKLIQNK